MHTQTWAIHDSTRQITLVIAFAPVFDAEYAIPPGKWPRSMPPIDEIFITHPFCFASHMRLQTCLDTSHVPVKFVLMLLLHSSSDQSNGEFTAPGTDSNLEM